MKLIIINKNKLDNFLVKQKYSQFLQSYDWGEFQKSFGFEVFRYGVEDSGELVAVISLVKKKLFGNFYYFYAPRGPILECRFSNVDSRMKIIQFLFNEIKIITKREGCIFLRFESVDKIRHSCLPAGTATFDIRKSLNLQPAKTLMLDLNKDEKELLADMHQKTRYNIRLAEKKGVEIVEATENDFDEFWKLMTETNKRDGFRLHAREYYYKMLNFNEDTNKLKIKNLKLKLFSAKYKEKIVSANIISFFGDTVTYMHGASSDENRNVMAPYLLQWEVIRKSKQLGFKYYDFFGVDSEKWPGVTKYKKGFCVKNLKKCEIKYPGTYDLIFNSLWYNVYKALREIRRIIKL